MFATLVMVMLGGAWIPSFLFPEWVQTVTLVVPTRWAVDGLDAIIRRGFGAGAVLPAIAVQLGFALAFASLAIRKFRRSLDERRHKEGRGRTPVARRRRVHTIRTGSW